MRSAGSDIGEPSFGNLPDAMVAQMLDRSPEVTEKLRRASDGLVARRSVMRERALEDDVVKQVPADVPTVEGKTCVAVDGSRAIERMASFHVYAAAAIRVPGFGGTAEAQPPDFDIEMHALGPVADGERLISAMMAFMECELAVGSDHDLVLLDGSIFSIVLTAGLALQSAKDRHDELSNAVFDRWTGRVRDAVPELLQSTNVVAIPKGSTAANEFARNTGVFANRETDMNGMTTANLILEPGEYCGPFPLPTEGLDLSNTPMTSEYVFELNMLLERVGVVYFRPSAWSPAYRIEMPEDAASDSTRLEERLALIRNQCVNPSMREPYPLYLADRFVKSLGRGVAAVIDAVRSDVTANSSDLELVSRFLSESRTDPYRDSEGDISW